MISGDSGLLFLGHTVIISMHQRTQGKLEGFNPSPLIFLNCVFAQKYCPSCSYVH